MDSTAGKVGKVSRVADARYVLARFYHKGRPSQSVGVTPILDLFITSRLDRDRFSWIAFSRLARKDPEELPGPDAQERLEPETCGERRLNSGHVAHV